MRFSGCHFPQTPKTALRELDFPLACHIDSIPPGSASWAAVRAALLFLGTCPIQSNAKMVLIARLELATSRFGGERSNPS